MHCIHQARGHGFARVSPELKTIQTPTVILSLGSANVRQPPQLAWGPDCHGTAGLLQDVDSTMRSFAEEPDFWLMVASDRFR